MKHGLVERVQDYPWSTFHRFARLGEYDLDPSDGDLRDDWE